MSDLSNNTDKLKNNKSLFFKKIQTNREAQGARIKLAFLSLFIVLFASLSFAGSDLAYKSYDSSFGYNKIKEVMNAIKWVASGNNIYYILGKVGIANSNPVSALQVGNVTDNIPQYMQIDANITGPPSIDCDEMHESGRLFLAQIEQRLYVCNGDISYWDYVQLT